MKFKNYRVAFIGITILVFFVWSVILFSFRFSLVPTDVLRKFTMIAMKVLFTIMNLFIISLLFRSGEE